MADTTVHLLQTLQSICYKHYSPSVTNTTVHLLQTLQSICYKYYSPTVTNTTVHLLQTLQSICYKYYSPSVTNTTVHLLEKLQSICYKYYSPSVTNTTVHLLQILQSICYKYSLKLHPAASPSGRAVWGVGLRPLACWDCGFKSRRRHGCLSVVSVVFCQVEASATSWSLVQRSPTECGESLCVI
jgi:phage tail protein X